jgi:prevent-host-death family protein
LARAGAARHLGIATVTVGREILLKQRIETETVPASQARQRFGELIKQVYHRRSRVVVEKGGIPVIALVSVPDLERWTRLERERDERYKVLDDIHARNADRSPEEVEQDVAAEIAALREEKRSRAVRRPRA